MPDGPAIGTMPACLVERYFDEVQIQHQSRYAYGEEIAVLVEQRDDSLSLTRRYRSFVHRLIDTSGPWDDPGFGSESISGAPVRIPDRNVSPYRGLQPFS